MTDVHQGKIARLASKLDNSEDADAQNGLFEKQLADVLIDDVEREGLADELVTMALAVRLAATDEEIQLTARLNERVDEYLSALSDNQVSELREATEVATDGR